MISKIKWVLWLLFGLTNLFALLFVLTSLIFFFQHVGDKSFGPNSHNTSPFMRFIFRAAIPAPYWVQSYFPIYSDYGNQLFSILPFFLFPIGYLLLIIFAIFAFFRDYNLTIFPFFGLLVLLTMPYGYVVGISYIITSLLLILISSEYSKYIAYFKKYSNDVKATGKQIASNLRA